MRVNFKNTSYTMSFKSKNQLPLFMVIKESYVNGSLDFAEILFKIKGKAYRQLEKNSIQLEKRFSDLYEINQ